MGDNAEIEAIYHSEGCSLSSIEGRVAYTAGANPKYEYTISFLPQSSAR
ncbi:MAG: hypothetical protein R3D00_14500 [Bacteroidia bacterium]